MVGEEPWNHWVAKSKLVAKPWGPRYFYLWQAYFWWPMWPSEFASCHRLLMTKVRVAGCNEEFETVAWTHWPGEIWSEPASAVFSWQALQQQSSETDKVMLLIRVTFFLRWEHRLRFAATVSRSQMHRTYFSCLWFDDAISWRCLAAPCVGVWLWALRVVASVALIWWSCRGLSGLSSLSGLSAGVIYPLLI